VPVIISESQLDFLSVLPAASDAQTIALEHIPQQSPYMWGLGVANV